MVVTGATVDIKTVNKENLIDALKYGETLEILDNGARHIWIKKDKLNEMARKAKEDLHNELYPDKIGKAAEARIPEIRVTILAKYEGYESALEELDVDVKDLKSLIEKELDIINK